MTKDSRLYPNCGPIAYIDSLAKHLGVPTNHLIDISNNAESHWRRGQDIVKPNGDVRQTHSATPELKNIHARVKNTILRKTKYPNYLFGSLPKTIEHGVRNHISNAKLHAGKRLIISADIKGYFPSVNESVVRGIWQGFYPFSPEVAEILTKLTTYQNQMPQGWSCSSYLAQLVFWDTEHHVVEQMRDNDMQYSRLTDDITLSTNRTLKQREITDSIRTLNRMLNQKGTKINRSKTRVDSRARRQSVNKINISVRGMTLSKEYRKAVRAKVHKVVTDPDSFGEDLAREIQSANGKINYLGNFHHRDAKNLKLQISALRQSRR